MGSQPAKHLLLIFNSSDHPGGNSFFQGKLNYTSMRYLNFLEEKLYLWSSRKKFFGNSFPKCCHSLSSERSFRNTFFLPFPFLTSFHFLKHFILQELTLYLILSLASLRGGGEVKEGSFGIKSVCQAFMRSRVFFLVCWNHYHLRPEYTSWEMREFIIIFH